MTVPELLEIAVQTDRNVVRFNRKVLSTPSAQTICAELLQLARSSGQHELRLDFGDVEFLTVAGLGAFLALDAELRSAGGGLLLHNGADGFHLARLSGILDVPATPASRQQAEAQA